MTPSAMQTMDPAMQKMAKDLLELTKNPTYVARKSGNWSDASTWAGGKVPGEGARVSIGKGLTVKYDQQSDARIDTIGVEGKLKFATDRNTKLLVKNVAIAADGDLEIGTKGNPIKAGVKAEIVITEDGSLDAAQLGRGLVSAGSVEIYGEEKVSHLKVAKDPRKGDSQLTLEKKPTNWRVGDRLVLTGTQLSADPNGQKWDAQVQDEEVSIEAISGNTITLDRALSFDHTTPRSDLKAYVANQSRNVVISSENAGTASDKSKRGHVMFMHSNAVDVRYAEFKDLGRTNKLIPTDDFKKTSGTYTEFVKDGSGNKIAGDRKNIEGRYAVHVHKTGTKGDPAVLVGNSIDGSPGWGMTIHDSSAIAENNVTYDIDGAAFVTESGNETGAFRNNIAINTGPGVDGYIEKQGTGTHDFGRTGVGFWLQGRLFENEGNVAASSRNVGMFYFHRGVNLIDPRIEDLPTPDLVSEVKADGTVNVDDPPIQNFKNNEVFASGQGLKIIKDFPRQHSDLRTKMDGFKAWEVETGAEPQYTSHYILKDFDLIGAKNKSPQTDWKNRGLFLHKNTQDFVFDNMKIEGFTGGIGMRPDGGFGGPTPPDDTELVWVDLQMKNNGSDLSDGFKIDSDKWLKSSDLRKGPLEFRISGDSDLSISGDEVNSYSDIKGVKVDSLGEIDMPIGDESLSFNYYGAKRLADKGYYTLPDGSRAAKFEHYFSDRVTGDTIKVPVIIKFKEDWWWGNSPKSLGNLDPNSAEMKPSKVTVPESRYSLNLGGVSPSDPVSPSQPAPTDEVDPVNPSTPTPTDEVDPVDPATPAPTDEVDPIDPASPAPIAEADPVDPVGGNPTSPIELDKSEPTNPVKPKPLTPSNPLQPVAAYSFESGSGADAKDTSTAGQNNPGELWNGVAWAEGVKGGGLLLNGTGSLRVKSSTDINRGTHEARSLSMWFNPEDLTPGKKQVIYEEGGANRGLNVYLEGDRLYVGEWQLNAPADQPNSWISADNVKAGEWQHVAFVLEGDRQTNAADFTAYLNGEEIGSEQSSVLRSHASLSLGAVAGRTRFHDGVSKGAQGLVGSIDETQVFNQALTAGQVETLAAEFA